MDRQINITVRESGKIEIHSFGFTCSELAETFGIALAYATNSVSDSEGEDISDPLSRVTITKHFVGKFVEGLASALGKSHEMEYANVISIRRGE